MQLRAPFNHNRAAACGLTHPHADVRPALARPCDGDSAAIALARLLSACLLRVQLALLKTLPVAARGRGRRCYVMSARGVLQAGRRTFHGTRTSALERGLLPCCQLQGDTRIHDVVLGGAGWRQHYVGVRARDGSGGRRRRWYWRCVLCVGTCVFSVASACSAAIAGER